MTKAISALVVALIATLALIAYNSATLDVTSPENAAETAQFARESVAELPQEDLTASDAVTELSGLQRFDAAFKQQQKQFDLNASNRTNITHTIVEAFLPEAAEIVSRQQGITTEAATEWIEAEMLKAANRAEDEYVAEWGYGTIVRDLRSGQYSSFLRQILQSDRWIYSRPVIFDRDYDFGQVDLHGLPPIHIDDVVYHSELTSPESLTYEDFSMWEDGKSLTIAYAAQTGAVLLDPVTGKYIEIINGLEDHPIELIYKDKVGEGSTASEVVAANEIIEVWAIEIARIYNRLRQEYPEQVGVFNNAEQKWESYCEADQSARRVAFGKPGSIYSITAARDRVALYRNHALRLAGWGRY